jgi:hypothetical protein
MKFSSAAILFAATSAESPLARTRRQAPDDTRRYSQLVDQMTYYNNDFDDFLVNFFISVIQ